MGAEAHLMIIWTDNHPSSAAHASEGPASSPGSWHCLCCNQAGEFVSPAPFLAALRDTWQEAVEDAPWRLPRWLFVLALSAAVWRLTTL
jgi:hypothetical protein